MIEITGEMVREAQKAYDEAPTLGWMFNEPRMKYALEAALAVHDREQARIEQLRNIYG